MKKGAFLKKVEAGLDPVYMNKHFSIMILLLHVVEHYDNELSDYLEPYDLSKGSYLKKFEEINKKLSGLAKSINPYDLSIDKKLFLASDFERFIKIVDKFMAED